MNATTSQKALLLVKNHLQNSIEIDDLSASKTLKEVLVIPMGTAKYTTKSEEQTTTPIEPQHNFTSINFDESSAAWMKNKIKLPNGQYKYVCGKITKSGKKCKNSMNCFLHK